MTTPRLVTVLALAGGLLAGVPAAVSAQSLPTIPGLPGGTPTIPAVPGQEKARFKVVVEGVASSSALANGGGDGGAGCNVTIKDVDIDERFEYGRGRGVTMEFVRFRAAGRQVISLQRSGRAGDASFAVRGKIQRTVDADGLLTRAPIITGHPCPVATEHPAASEGCNREYSMSADMKFVYGAHKGKLALQPTSTEGLRNLITPVSECPASQIFGGLDGIVSHPWPTPLKLPAQRLRASTIFGKRRGFTLHFVAGHIADAEAFPRGFSGKIDHSANHHAVARFTRLK